MTRRSASAALMPLAEAVAALTASAAPVAPRLAAPASVLGAIAAETVEAGAALPPQAIALRDGWAVAFADASGATAQSPVPLRGGFRWVDSGDPLPASRDTVLPFEAVEDGAATSDAPAGEGVRAAGGDLAPGDALVRAGERLRPLHLLGLAAMGIADILVRIPRVRLITAGRPPDGRDALGPAVAAILTGWGCDVLSVAHQERTVEALAEAMAGGEADAVITIGGTGFGRGDRSLDALARAGIVAQSGIALRPGETNAFGRVRDRPLLLLPGSPEACLAALLCLARPLIDRLAGAEPGSPSPPEPIGRKITSAIGLAEIVYVRRTSSGLEPLGGAELPLRRLLQADGVVLVPPEQEGYPEGTRLEMMAL